MSLGLRVRSPSRLVLAAVLLGAPLLAASPGPALGHVADVAVPAPRASPAPPRPGDVANAALREINRGRPLKAKAFATTSVVTKLDSYHDRGYVFLAVGRCNLAAAPDTCPSTMKKAGVVAGRAVLHVSGSDQGSKVVWAAVTLK